MTYLDAKAAGGDRETETERRDVQIRRYAGRVTIGVTLLCNSVFLFGVWASGVDLDGLVRMPDEYNPEKDVCVRFAWHRVDGLTQPIRLCSEWINLSDPSGKTHAFQRDTMVVQDAGGNLYFEHAPRVDYRLAVLVGFIVLVIGCGVVLNRYLIARYRLRLEQPASPVHP